MTTSPESVIRDVLGTDHPSREALAALEALVAERDELAARLDEADTQLARLRRIADLAARVLEEMGGRRSATSVLTATAELRAALKER